jgi:hypothetical protein
MHSSEEYVRRAHEQTTPLTNVKGVVSTVDDQIRLFGGMPRHRGPKHIGPVAVPEVTEGKSARSQGGAGNHKQHKALPGAHLLTSLPTGSPGPQGISGDPGGGS